MRFLLVLILISSPSFATKIYSWEDENGVKHYSANKPEDSDVKNNYKEKEIKDKASEKNQSSVSKSEIPSDSYSQSDDCEPEPEKGWDAATLRNIRNYYNTRTKQCKQFYKAGSYQIKNCFQEQKEIKEKKMKEHRKRMKTRCK